MKRFAVTIGLALALSLSASSAQDFDYTEAQLDAICVPPPEGSEVPVVREDGGVLLTTGWGSTRTPGEPVVIYRLIDKPECASRR